MSSTPGIGDSAFTLYTNRRGTAQTVRISAPEIIIYSLALAATISLGLINIYLPFTGDTALFLIGAQALQSGEILYVDFWDNKQPGIYLFFYVAGSIFGFSEEGVHKFEIIWWISFTILCFSSLRKYFNHKWLSAAVPLIFLFVYYADLRSWIATQLEILVGFPILFSLVFLGRSYGSHRGAALGYGLAGILAGFTVVFKLALAPMFIVFILLATFEQTRTVRPETTFKFIASLWLGFTFGVVVVLSATALVFFVAGGLDQFLWTSFEYPLEALSEVRGAPLSRLVKSAGWYVVEFAPWFPFVVLAAFRSFRADEPALSRLMWAWLFSAIVVILLQRFSWWPYHLCLLFVPTSVLAVRGIDLALIWLRDNAGAGPRLRVGAGALLLLPGLAAAGIPAQQKARELMDTYSNPEMTIADYRSKKSDDYARALRVSEFVKREDAAPGKIYVFGNPLIYLLSDRQKALHSPGWGWHVFYPAQWQALASDLARHHPVYVFVESRYRNKITNGDPRIWSVLDEHYTVSEETEDGRWYRLITP